MAVSWIGGTSSSVVLHYEVQASVSYEETPDYLGQRMLHWVDEAAFFQVLMLKEEYFFGGVVDLKMQAAWRRLRG